MIKRNLALVESNDHLPLSAISTEEPVKWIQLARLSEASRDRVWGYLRANRPEIAESLEQTTRNPQVQELLAEYNASLKIQQDWLPPSIVASLTFH